MSTEALHMAKTAYEGYHAVGTWPEAVPFADLPDTEKQAWEAAAAAMYLLIMSPLTRSSHEPLH